MEDQPTRATSRTADPPPDPRPKWVWGFVVAAVLAGIIAAAAAGGGPHGPARHQPETGPIVTDPPADHQAPRDHDG